jgi:hypothetical protein
MKMSPILTNGFAILLFLVFAVLPAYYTNKYLLKLIRPKESLARGIAHIIILLAAGVVYTSLVVVILVKFVLEP